MGLQAQMLVSYFIYLKETVSDVEERNEKVLKAVDDYLLGIELGLHKPDPITLEA